LPPPDWSCIRQAHRRAGDTQLAASGEQAIETAVLMIASRDELRHGDQLTRLADDAADSMLV
jgi:hypothetical protein